jgi:FKBP-type peptidyl-prolyl cis-trans isomerase SlyD
MEEMVQEVPRDQFPEDEVLEVGDQFQVHGEEMSLIATVKEVDGDRVVLDANHPLAGRSLKFNLEIVDVRDSSEEERARLVSNESGCGCSDGEGHHH